MATSLLRRRKLLQARTLSTLELVAGYLSGRTDDDSGAPTESPTDTATAAPTATPTPAPSAEELLPAPENDWRLTGTDDKDWRMLGGETGIIGEYRNGNDTLFNVVIKQLADGYSAASHAERWACIGWDVAVAYQGYAFAAGTGTTQQTFTPRALPHMAHTPVPGSEDEPVALLSYSPLLTPQIIETNRQRCE